MAGTHFKRIIRPASAGLILCVLLIPGLILASEYSRFEGSSSNRQDPGRISAQQDTSRIQVGSDTTDTEKRASGLSDSLVTGWASLVSDGTITTFFGSPEKPAWIRMQDIEVRAGIIIFDSEKEVITAIPMPDTSSTGEGKELHRPVFSQGAQDLVGSQMFYDLATDKGKVYEGRTTYEFGYYHGSEINAYKSEPNYLTVRGARFTTCDLDHPHYYFSANKMKIIPDDKVVAKGIRFNLLGIPIPPRLFKIPIVNLEVFPPLPFIIKSIRTGRQSGILMPKYSDNSLTGLTLKDLGYYWAPSDYFDGRVLADITEKEGMILRGRVRYKLRYRLQGNIDAAYNYNRRTGTRRWETRFNHNQTLNPTMQLTSRGQFTSSSDFNQRLSDDLGRRLERILRSHVNMTKRFEGGSNLAVTLSQTRYLDQDITDTQFPSATFRVSRRPLFASVERGEGEGGPGGLTGFGITAPREEEITGPKWYENFYIDYNVALRSNIKTQPVNAGTPAESDSTTKQAGIEQRTNLTYSGKALGWLNLQPSFSAREHWYLGDTARDNFQRRTLWNTSLRASTKLYGTTNHPLGLNADFRHVVEPSLSLSYAPDFSDLPDVPALFGRNPTGQQSINFSLSQLFQMKRVAGEEEKKTDLARVTTSGSYNKNAVGHKLNDINTSIVSNAGRVLNLQVTMRHSFYSPDTDKFQQKPILMAATYRSSLRMDSGTLAQWLGIGRGKVREEEEKEEEILQQPPIESVEEETPFAVPTRDAGGLYSATAERARASGSRWNLSINHFYSWTKGGLLPSHSIDGSLNINIPKWTLTVAARYDFARKDLVRQSFNITRDLHCWEARLQVVTTGPGKGYWFVIAIKDIPEIKYERRKTVF